MAARRAAAHVFVEDIEAGQLTEEDHHHMRRVLRLRPGEPVSAADGRGHWRLFAYQPGGVLDPLGPTVAVLPPSPPLTVAFALAKGERSEWTVQKLTEIGIDRLVVLLTDRGVVRWDAERTARQVGRLRLVARQAAMQSRRMFLPDIPPPEDFATTVEVAGERAVLAEPGGGPPSLARRVVLVGPEGGWSQQELAVGLPTVQLVPGILRTETAAVAAGVVLAALRAGLVDAARVPLTGREGDVLGPR